MPRPKTESRSLEAPQEATGSTFGLMSEKQLSDLTGWSRITINGWTKNDRDGPRLPIERESTGPGKPTLYSLRRFIEWYAAKEAADAVRTARKSWELESANIRAGGDGDEVKNIARLAAIAEAQETIDKAEMVAMDKAMRLRELVVLDPVLHRIGQILQIVREGMNRAPKRLAQKVSTVRDPKRIEAVAQEVIDETLEEMETAAALLENDYAA